MSVRTIVISDEQLELIAEALEFMVLNVIYTTRTENVLVKAAILKAYCDQTRNEPADDKMIHKFAR